MAIEFGFLVLVELGDIITGKCGDVGGQNAAIGYTMYGLAGVFLVIGSNIQMQNTRF